MYQQIIAIFCICDEVVKYFGLKDDSQNENQRINDVCINFLLLISGVIIKKTVQSLNIQILQ